MGKGKEYEELACQYLSSIGYRILERNFHCRFSEIDIVALEGDTLVIVEVKGSKNESYGLPQERFSPEKLERLVRCAYLYMQRRNMDMAFRIDLIAVLGDRIEHFKNIYF
jgi:putative endonuclease